MKPSEKARRGSATAATVLKKLSRSSGWWRSGPTSALIDFRAIVADTVATCTLTATVRESASYAMASRSGSRAREHRWNWSAPGVGDM